MPLPSLPKAKFMVKLRSMDKAFAVNPFTVAQEGVLLEAIEAKDDDTRIDAVMQLASECVVNKNVKVEDLPFFDLEMLFIKLRIHSIGKDLSVMYKCQNPVDGNPCGGNIKHVLDLNEYDYFESDEHETKFMLTDDIGMTLKYPSLNDAKNVEGQTDTDLIVSCVDTIFTTDDVHYASDVSNEEIKEFLQPLSLVKKREIVNKFFEQSPRGRLGFAVTCPDCGKEHDITLTGIDELFT